MNEFFNPKVGLRALFSGPHWLAPYLSLVMMTLYDGSYPENSAQEITINIIDEKMQFKTLTWPVAMGESHL
jgi:hypothetical protein